MGCSSQTLRSFSSCFLKRFLNFFFENTDNIILVFCKNNSCSLSCFFFKKLEPNVFSMFFLFFFFFKTVFRSEKQGEQRKYKEHIWFLVFKIDQNN